MFFCKCFFSVQHLVHVFVVSSPDLRDFHGSSPFTMAAMAESASLLESDLESAAPPETPCRLRAFGAVLLGLASAAILAALLLEPQDDSHGHRHGLRLLQAVGGGSAIGSCWLKCGAAVGKAIHTAGAFIARRGCEKMEDLSLMST